MAAGAPAEILTPDLVKRVFGIRSHVLPDPVSDAPLIVPIGRHHVR